ncbi:MAG: HEPN domain-containing protein [FCB group bacterium]|jgi:HEPN domain-containing protein
MTKEEHIEYWINSANDDYKIFELLFNNAKYLYSFFIGNLVIEKIIKAFWVRDNQENIPPKTHNLIYLIKQTKIKLSEDDLLFCTRFNDFQIQGRYPDYQNKIKQILTPETINELKTKFEELRLCLLNMIA